MQGLPAPPTDNLYKFMAIGGLVVFVVSMYLASRSLEEVIARAHEQAGRVAVTSLDLEELTERARELKSSVDRLVERKIKIDGEDNEDEGFWEDASRVLDRKARVESDLLELNKATAQAKIDLVYLEGLTAIAGKQRWLLTIVALVGMLFSIWGFVLWYQQVQKHMDRLLVREVEKSNREYARLAETVKE